MACRFLLSILLPAAITAMAQPPFPFIPTGSMSTPRMDHTATLLLNGKVLIAGGALAFSINGNRVSASAELYDPATGTFAPTGSMTTPRFSHTATLLGDGKVLIAGGITSGEAQSLATAELYDPATGMFTPTGSMTSPRGCSSTLLADGKVLVTGCASPSNSAAAELYDPANGMFAMIGTPPYPRRTTPTQKLRLSKRLCREPGAHPNLSARKDPIEEAFHTPRGHHDCSAGADNPLARSPYAG
jgi:hypothetical protein